MALTPAEKKQKKLTEINLLTDSDIRLRASALGIQIPQRTIGFQIANKGINPGQFERQARQKKQERRSRCI